MKASDFVRLYSPSQFQMPIVLRDFPAGCADCTMLGARFVEYRIRVIDMHVDSPAYLHILQQAQAFFNWNVTHLVRGLTAALDADQLVVAPECAVEQENVGAIDLCQELIVEFLDCGNICNAPLGRSTHERCRPPLFRNRP